MAKNSYRNPRLDVRYKYDQRAVSLPNISDELCYANNPNSLFRKYKELVTWFANTDQGREYLRIEEITEPISLFLPNGYHRKLDKDIYQLTVYSRAIFSKKLYPALMIVDTFLPYLSSPEETKQLFLFKLGLGKLPLARMPQIAGRIFLTSFGPFYPDPDPESTTVDGWVQRNGVNETFSTIRSGSGITANTTDLNENVAVISSSSSTNQYAVLRRGIFLFDTSSLGSGAAVIDATISFRGTAKNNANGSPDFYVSGSTPNTNTNLIASDYGQLQTTSFGNVTYANYSTTAYNDITLNASGIANISTTGISKFGIQLSWDINNDTTTLGWVSGDNSSFKVNFADTGGTTSDPKLAGNYTTTSTSTSTSTTTTSTSTSSSTSITTSTSSSTTNTNTTTSTSTTSTSSSTTSTSTSTTSTSSSTTTSTSTSSSTSTTSTSSSTTMPLSISVDAG